MDLKIHTKHRLLIPVFTKQMLRTMRLTVILLLAVCIQTSAEDVYSQITLSERNTPFSEVVRKIQAQSGYDFVSTYQTIQEAGNVTIDVRNVSLQKALEECLKHKPLTYSIIGKTVVLKVQPRRLSEEKPEMISPLITLPPIQKEIRGRVTDENGNPLQGVSVSLKGNPTTGTTTNERGDYSLSVGEDDETLVFSSVGFETQEVPIAEKLLINVVLNSSLGELGEVVVTTALGIERQERSLSYNVQQVMTEDATMTQNGNFVNALAGKVAGATINASSSGLGGAVRVVLRGTKSIAGNNNALYVIDGIPMPNIVAGQPDDIFSGAGQTGDFISHLNPEDIESISVLSGASAAALYGSEAANGVIMITTKKGRNGHLSVSVNNTTTFSNPLILPEFQNTYGVSEVGSYYSWGSKLSKPSSYRPSDFFQTGVNATSSVSLTTGNDNSQTYISLGNVEANGIIPNNNYSRYNFTARQTVSLLNDKLDIDLGFMTGLIHEQNMVAQGQYFNPLIAVYLFPPGDDFEKVKAFERYDPSRNLDVQFWELGDNGLMLQNPYWVTQRDIFGNAKERYMTTLSLKYNLADWIDISVRTKLDKDNEKDEKKFAASTNMLFASENGYYSLNTLNSRQIYGEGMIHIDKDIDTDMNITANLGTSIEDINYKQYLYGGKLQGVANLFSYTNVNKSLSDMSQTGYHKQKQSAFGSAQFGYRNEIFVDVSARNDWASTLAESDAGKSFFYSSVGISGVLTDMLNVNSSLLSYFKLRASYSQVGNEPDPFLTIPTYPMAGGFPVTQTRMPNPNLKPELTKAWEAGFNSEFFHGALRLDGTFYFSRTYNQFFQPTLSSASGYTSVIVNAGRVDNKGIEASLRYSTKVGRLNWNTYANYSLNRNKIIKLLPGWENPITGEIVSLHELDQSGTGSYKMVLKEGGSMGDIYVNTLKVDEHGVLYVDPSSKTVVSEPNVFVYAGNSNPRYNIGWGNDFNYRGIRLSFMVSARVGGIVVSNTQAILDAFGVSKASADARDAGGVLVNNYPIPAQPYYQVIGAGASGGIASMYSYSATNVRLAELSVGYDIPLNKWNNFIKSANVSFVGHNLFLFYNKAPFDPELTSNTQTYYQGIDYFMMPSLRSLGFSVKLNF